MTGSAIPTTGRRLINPAWEFISLRTQPAPLRCALTSHGVVEPDRIGITFSRGSSVAR
jgi:hypothetical protein